MKKIFFLYYWKLPCKLCKNKHFNRPLLWPPSPVYCLLSTNYFPVSHFYCLLSTVYCLLSTIYCLLSNVDFYGWWLPKYYMRKYISPLMPRCVCLVVSRQKSSSEAKSLHLFDRPHSKKFELFFAWLASSYRLQ